MEKIVQPEYKFRIHIWSENGQQIPVVDVAEPYSYLGDIYNFRKEFMLEVIHPTNQYRQ